MSDTVTMKPWKAVDFDCPKCRAEFGSPCVTREGNLTQTHKQRYALQRPPPCGTYAAFQRHKKAGEEIDGPCRRAAADHARKWREKSPDLFRASLTIENARHRAHVRLVELHPEDFQRLFDEEKASIQ